MLEERIHFALLSHMLVYGMTTQRVVAHHFGLPRQTAADVLKQLVGNRLAKSAELTPDEDYYYLQPRAAEVLRVASISGDSFSGTRKIVAYGTLHFCCLGSPYRPKIPDHLFPERFPQLYRRGPKLNYYTEGSRLGYIRVEHPDSIPGDVIRVINTARKDVGQRTFGNKGPGLPAFQTLVDEKRFVITLLTPFESRADRITKAVNRENEVYGNYHAHLDAKRSGKRTAEYQFLDFVAWHRKDKHRLAPLPAPPLEVHVIPELFQLVRPNSVSVKTRSTPTDSKPKRRKRHAKRSTKSKPKIATQFDKRLECGPFDLIADVHGCCDELEQLLGELGYERRTVADSQTGWASLTFVSPQPSHGAQGRKAIFLGNVVGYGPRIIDAISLVRNMVNSDDALCVAGNQEMQLLSILRGLRGKTLPSGLEESLAAINALRYSNRQPFRNQLMDFLDSLPIHLVLDKGNLVVAHAGLSEVLHGRNSKESRSFAINGPTTGKTDERGRPVLADWAAGYRGKAMVVYGHTPVEKPQWRNNTVNIDTACFLGGELTALRYPECEFVSITAKQSILEGHQHAR